MTEIALTEIHDLGRNPRRVPAEAAAEAGLRASMAALGQLVPIIVKRNHGSGGGYVLVDGARRLRAARALGLATLRADVAENLANRPDAAISGASNMARAPMHPVDQWRLVQQLGADGFTLKGAAEFLGLSQREAQRMALLAKLHPPIIEAMAGRPLPELDDLRDIAQANIEAQAAAWEAYEPDDAAQEVDWPGLAGALEVKRLPMVHARFDEALATKHGVTWSEDLFAEPGTPDAGFWTTNVAGYLAAQQEWLETVHVPGLLAQRYQAVVATKDKWDVPAPVPNAVSRFEADPEKAPKKLIRCFWVARLSGQVHCSLWERQAAAPKPGKATEPPPALAEKAPAGAFGETEPSIPITPPPAAEAATAEEPQDPPPPPGKPPPERTYEALSKAGHKLVAETKLAALHAWLDGGRERPEAGEMLRLFQASLLAWAANNVTVQGQNGKRMDMELLAVMTTLADGTPRQMTGLELSGLARILLRRLLVPEGLGPFGSNSGEVFAWACRTLGVPRPRYDTPALLEEIDGKALRSLALAAGLKPSNGLPVLKRELAGKAPDWAPYGGAWEDTIGPDPDTIGEGEKA